MTVEEHLQQLIGGLVFRIAHLEAEIASLKAQLAAKGKRQP